MVLGGIYIYRYIDICMLSPTATYGDSEVGRHYSLLRAYTRVDVTHSPYGPINGPYGGCIIHPLWITPLGGLDSRYYSLLTYLYESIVIHLIL